MTKIGRIIGGALSIIGGALTIYGCILGIEYIQYFEEAIITFSVTLIFAIISIIGGILLILDKTYGGILPIIGGAMLIIGFWIPISPILSLTTNWATIVNVGFYIDPILAIIGGIVGLAVGKAA